MRIEPIHLVHEVLALSCIFIILSCSNEKQESQKEEEQANFIVFIADDVSWDSFGCTGNKTVKTPNIDRFASEGLLFKNAYLTASSCSPSRNSILSGKYPHSNGAPELHMPLPESEIPFPLLLKENGYHTVLAGKSHIGKAAQRAFDIHMTGKKINGEGGEAQWVRLLKDRPKNKPFFMWYASYDAHRKWSTDISIAEYDPLEVEVPPYFIDDGATRMDIVHYYKEISRFDHYIGEVRKELENQGVLDNTMIIIMSDNGMAFPRCKTRVYDSGMKTPFVVYSPKEIDKKGMSTSSLISSIDLAPTILEYAKIDVPKAYQGVSFSPILKNNSAETRESVFADHNWHDYEAHERMMRTKDYMYILNSRPNLTNCGPADSKRSPTQAALNEGYKRGELSVAQADVFVSPRPKEELYDMSNDSLQLLNLASVPKYEHVLNEMRFALKKWREETGDSTPEELTKDWFDRETGEKLEVFDLRERGEIPGIKQ